MWPVHPPMCQANTPAKESWGGSSAPTTPPKELRPRLPSRGRRPSEAAERGQSLCGGPLHAVCSVVAVICWVVRLRAHNGRARFGQRDGWKRGYAPAWTTQLGPDGFRRVCLAMARVDGDRCGSHQNLGPFCRSTFLSQPKPQQAPTLLPPAIANCGETIVLPAPRIQHGIPACPPCPPWPGPSGERHTSMMPFCGRRRMSCTCDGQ